MTEHDEIEFAIRELTETVKTLKSGKAPGIDRITAKMVKNIGQPGIEILLRSSVWHGSMKKYQLTRK